MQSRLETIWERVRYEVENTATERVSISVSIHPSWVFTKTAWVVVGIVLAAVLVSVLILRDGPPFSFAGKAADENPSSLSKASTEETGRALPLTASQDVFEVATVKLVPQSSEAFNLASMGETAQSVMMGCPGGYAYTTQLSPGRLTIPGASVLTLVMLAYGRDCTLVDGGPAWARSGEYYEIQALLPEGTPRETIAELLRGSAPRLQRMLQNILADRFRLVLKRELREVPVYALTLASPGKMQLSPEERLPPPAGFPAIPGMPAPTLGRGQAMSMPGVQLFGHALSMSDLARELRRFAGRIVVDKTGLSDVFDVHLKFASNTGLPAIATLPALPQSIPPPPGAPPQSTPMLQEASLEDALQDQLGLKMESAKVPLEILVIERVERPSEN
jgi:uncharacterized protein (TIGR03435 family)